MKRTHFHALYFLLSDFKFILLNIKLENIKSLDPLL